mmetsp:Transcript_69998/g.123716  ORF Transcript_69998/g.123716 Transcript_69998/m.123716 type:complete len:123 (-) Transcript_69998:521-889(-)
MRRSRMREGVGKHARPSNVAGIQRRCFSRGPTHLVAEREQRVTLREEQACLRDRAMASRERIIAERENHEAEALLLEREHLAAAEREQRVTLREEQGSKLVSATGRWRHASASSPSVRIKFA